MAKFVKQTSDLAESLNRLQGFADNLISMETNRRIQLSREKEARMVDAYKYMVGEEDRQIQEIEIALQSIEDDMFARGVDLKNVPEAHRTPFSEELLLAAGEGAMELAGAKLKSSQQYKTALEEKRRKALEIKRNIDLFDDALSLADPASFGDPGIIDAEDVAHAGLQWMEANEQEGPEIMQRLERLQTESELERLQTDYYAKLARESQEKFTAAEAEFATADIRRGRFDIVKKEALEGVKAMAFPASTIIEEYRSAISLSKDIADGIDTATGKSLTSSEVTAKQELMAKEYNRLGVILAPWAMSQEQAAIEAQNFQTALAKAGNGNFQEIINYLKKGYSQYILWSQEGNQMSETYRADIQRITGGPQAGIDIADKDWLANLEMLWIASLRADEEQGIEQVKMSLDMFSEPLIDESDYSGRKDDLELFNQGEW